MAVSLLNQTYIRPISLQDLNIVVNFKKELQDETDFLVFNLNDDPKSLIQERNNIIKLNLFSNSTYLGAFVDNVLGGLLLFRGGRYPRTKHIGELGIGIKKEYWGQGIGKKLILELFNWCTENGIKKATLKVRKDNLRAISLYQNLGFNCESVRMGLVQGHSTLQEFLVMGKIFD